MVGHRILGILHLPPSSLLMHTYAYLFSTFLDQNGKAQLHVGVLLWESLSGLCLPYCLWPSTLLTEPNSLSTQVRGSLDQGGKKVRRAKWQACLGSAWPDSWLGSGATELGQELSPWAPALRPWLSDSAVCGAGCVLCQQRLLAAPAVVEWLPSLPTHTVLQRGLISDLP